VVVRCTLSLYIVRESDLESQSSKTEFYYTHLSLLYRDKVRELKYNMYLYTKDNNMYNEDLLNIRSVFVFISMIKHNIIFIYFELHKLESL
jgi:hypothetical protein